MRKPLRLGLAAALGGLLLSRPRLRRRVFSARTWKRVLLFGAAMLVAKPQEHRHVEVADGRWQVAGGGWRVAA